MKDTRSRARLLIALAYSTGLWATYKDVAAASGYGHGRSVANLCEDLLSETPRQYNRVTNIANNGHWREDTVVSVEEQKRITALTEVLYGPGYLPSAQLSVTELEILLDGKAVNPSAAVVLRNKLYVALERLLELEESGPKGAAMVFEPLASLRAVIARVS
jgi:alkylated DNA nucleotide flippase Atl1